MLKETNILAIKIAEDIILNQREITDEYAKSIAKIFHSLSLEMKWFFIQRINILFRKSETYVYMASLHKKMNKINKQYSKDIDNMRNHEGFISGVWRHEFGILSNEKPEDNYGFKKEDI